MYFVNLEIGIKLKKIKFTDNFLIRYQVEIIGILYSILYSLINYKNSYLNLMLHNIRDINTVWNVKRWINSNNQ